MRNSIYKGRFALVPVFVETPPLTLPAYGLQTLTIRYLYKHSLCALLSQTLDSEYLSLQQPIYLVQKQIFKSQICTKGVREGVKILPCLHMLKQGALATHSQQDGPLQRRIWHHQGQQSEHLVQQTDSREKHSSGDLKPGGTGSVLPNFTRSKM